MNHSKSPRSIRGPLFGAGAAGLILIGLMLSQFLPGTGTSTNDNIDPTRIPVNTDSKQQTTQPGDVKQGNTQDPQTNKPASSEKLPISAPTILEVMIDGKNYFYKLDNQWNPGDLNKIIELAAHATGDNTGIKVKIVRKPTSMTSAEESLMQGLIKSGLKESAVYLVPDVIKE